MRSTAYGLAWMFWQRHRVALSLFAGYGLLLAIATHMMRTGEARERMVLLTIPLMAAVPVLLGIFAHPEADIASGASGYPSHLLVLPVRTRPLALWPVLFGAVAMAGTWVLVGGLIFRVITPQVPLAWPSAMLAALMAMLQALMWTPFAVPYLRAALALILLPGIIIAGIYGHQSGVPESTLTGGFLAVMLLSAWQAQAGLALARRGDGTERAWTRDRPDARRPSESVEPAPPFTSAFRAQLWFEWSRNGVFLPLVTTILLLLASALLLAVANTEPASWGSGSLGPFTDIEPSVYLRIVPGALGIPIWLAVVMGCGARKSDTRARDLTVHPFIATRPFSSGRLVLAKITAAALSGILAWAVVLAFLFAWSFLPVRQGAGMTTLGRLLMAQATPATVAGAFCALLFLMFWTLRNQVSGLFVDLTGRPWIVNGLPVLMSTLFTLALYLGALLLPDPENRERAIRYAPTAIYFIAGIKVLADAGACFALWRSRLLPERWVFIFAWGWLAMLVFLAIGLRSIVPAGMLTPFQTVLAAFLWMPGARLALAPLSLHWNRHR